MSAAICSHTLGVTLCDVSAAICSHTLGVTLCNVMCQPQSAITGSSAGMCPPHVYCCTVVVQLCVRISIQLHAGNAVTSLTICNHTSTVTRWYSECVSVTENSHRLVQRMCVSYGEQSTRWYTVVCQLRRTVTRMKPYGCVSVMCQDQYTAARR